VAMLKRAVKPHPDLQIIELVDKHFTVRRTLPQLRRLFADSKLVLLMGADTFAGVPAWSNIDGTQDNLEFVVSLRGQYELPVVLHTSQSLRLPASAVTVVDSMQPNVSSTQMRLALALNHSVKGLLPSVRKYANKEWLYVHIPRSKNVDA
jgi:nicotinic acid mononucleotide adenylyltransferase